MVAFWIAASAAIFITNSLSFLLRQDMIYIDLDGVLVDWIGGFCKLLNIENPYNNPANYNKKMIDILVPHVIPDKKSFWRDLEHDFWANLEWTPDGKEILKLAESHGDVCILTAPSRNFGAFSGKAEWVSRNMPNYFNDKIIICSEKWRLSHNSILIDDTDKQVNAFNKFGRGILVPRPWNSGYKIVNPLVYLRNQLT